MSPLLLCDISWRQEGQTHHLLPVVQVGSVAQAASLEEIRDRGYLIVAVKDNRPPLGFTDTEGNLSGFEIDIARRLAADLLGDPQAVRFVPVANVERINAVLTGDVDMAIAALTLTEPRRRLVNFTEPYYLDGTAFVVNNSPVEENLPTLTRPSASLSPAPDPASAPGSNRDSSPALASNSSELNHLRAARIAVLNRSSTVAHVRYILPGAQLVGVDNYAAAQELLSRGEVAAFAGDASVLASWIHFTDDAAIADLQLLSPIISVEPLAIALPKGTQYNNLLTLINQHIRQWYSERWLQERAAYWQLPVEVLPTYETPE